MARDRQRAKRRQAERRAARLAERGAPGPVEGRASDGAAARERLEYGEPDVAGGGEAIEDREPDVAGGGEAIEDREPDGADPLASPGAGAPPEEAGRSDALLGPPVPPPPPALDTDDEELLEEEVGDEAEPLEDRAADRGAREGRERGRVLAFLGATWAELQRVQWPKRPAVTTMTGVVLGFVLIAGGYLGLLDAIFSRLIQAIL